MDFIISTPRQYDPNRFWISNDFLSKIFFLSFSAKGATAVVPPRPNLFNQPPPGMGGIVPEQPPNQILFLTNLPDETSEMMLSMLFTQ